MERVIMKLIVNSGNARSRAMEAIREAKNGNIDKANKKIKECDEFLGKAHEVQSDLIHYEASGEKREVTLLMVHAQDHLMNAISIKDIAKELIDIYKIINIKITDEH